MPTVTFYRSVRSGILLCHIVIFSAFNLEHFLPEILHIEDGRSQRSLSDDELAVVEYVFKREFSVPETHVVAFRYVVLFSLLADHCQR